jgi:hypothetical protein
MNTDRSKMRVGQRKQFIIGLVLILLLSSYELIGEGFQYSLTETTLELINSPPAMSRPDLLEQVRAIKESQIRIILHFMIHLGIVVIASGCLFVAARKDFTLF